MVGAYFNLSLFHVPAGLILGAVALTAGSSRKMYFLSNTRLNGAAICLAVVLAAQVLTGRGYVTLAMGGYVIAFTIGFYGLFLSESRTSIKFIVRGISLLYKYFLL